MQSGSGRSCCEPRDHVLPGLRISIGGHSAAWSAAARGAGDRALAAPALAVPVCRRARRSRSLVIAAVAFTAAKFRGSRARSRPGPAARRAGGPGAARGRALEAVDQPRAGAGEIRGGVDRDDARGAERLELVAVVVGLLGGALGVVAARHHDDDLGPGGLDLLPRAPLGVLSRHAEHVDPARVLDHLRRPVAGDVDRVEPLERGDADRLARPARPAARGRCATRRPGRGRRPRPCCRWPPRASHVAEHLAERVRVERDTSARVQPLGDRLDVLVGHGADGAQRLRDDQVGLRAPQRLLVELVDRLALLGQLAHGAVDLRRRQPGADHVARDPGQLAGLRG